MTHILIAEDEQRIASFIEKGLSANGFAVTTVADGPSAYDYAATGEFDLMVLDIGLPELDGFEVLRRLRSEGHWLEGGADDYMAKPFRFEELLARVRLRLTPTHTSGDSVLSCGGLQLDLRTRRALVGGRTVDLTAREFALAETFLRHAGQVLAREQLLSQVWGYDYDPGSNVVDVYVRYLRRKLGADRFVTLRGWAIGWRRCPNGGRVRRGRRRRRRSALAQSNRNRDRRRRTGRRNRSRRHRGRRPPSPLPSP